MMALLHSLLDSLVYPILKVMSISVGGINVLSRSPYYDCLDSICMHMGIDPSVANVCCIRTTYGGANHCFP